MTILLLCNRVPPAVDGVGDYTYNLAQALRQAGAKVFLICRMQHPVKPISAITVLPIIKSWKLGSKKSLMAAINQIKPDWIGVQYVPTGFHRSGLPLALPYLISCMKNAGYRIFTMFHEVKVRKQDLRSCLVGNLQHWIAQALCQHSEKIFTSIDLYAHLLRAYKTKTALIPIGANALQRQISAIERQKIREQFSPQNGPLLCIFGNRRLNDLLPDIQTFTDKYPNLKFVICGQNRSKFDPENFPFVQTTGYLPAAEIGAILQSCDIFISPDPVSKQGHGGSSNKSGSLAAACAAGLPIIGVKGNLNNALLQHGHNIFLIDKWQLGSLTAAIDTVISDGNFRKKLGVASQELYEQHLAWDVIANRFLQYLNS